MSDAPDAPEVPGHDGNRPDPATLAELIGQALEAIHNDDAHLAAARRAGQRMRQVIERVTATTAPPEVLDQVADRLADIEKLLEPHQAGRRYEGVAEASGFSYDWGFFDWSPQMGLANPLAPPVRARTEGTLIVADVCFGSAYEGPPGHVHGGHIAALFDEVLGLAQSLSGQAGMTGTLNVRYRRPTPLRQDLRAEAWLESVDGRKVTAKGRLLAGDLVTAEATGLFVSISLDRFRSLNGPADQQN